jgi:K+-transporting ATPase KdpF subunit
MILLTLIAAVLAVLLAGWLVHALLHAEDLS